MLYTLVFIAYTWYMESSWLFFNIDELLYRFHIYIVEPIVNLLSFRWLFRDSGAARALEQGQLGTAADAGFFDRWFVSPLYRIFGSRPSQEYDSVQEYLNPASERGLGDTLWGIVFGTGDKESIFSLIFGSFIGWVIIITIACYFLIKYLKMKSDFIKARHDLLYDLAHSGHTQKNANDKATRWQQITQQVNSEDVNLWKVAIMDADILLDEILSEQGYDGDGVANKLDSARSGGQLTTVDYASQAHVVRNKIAHHSDFILSHREAKVAISQYERFFNELYHL